MASLQITDLTTLNQTSVTSNFVLLSEMLQEAYPNYDVERGVISDVIIELASVLATATQQEVDLATQSGSLLQITANPSLADPSLANAVISNFLATRKAAAAASGQLTIIVLNLVPITIASGATFTYNNLTFITNNTFNAKTSSSAVVGTYDRLMTQVSNGYAFTITVSDSVAEAAGNIPQGTTLTPATLPPGFVTCYAQSDFTGGADAETNQSLISRLGTTISAKAWSNPTTNTNLIESQSQFTNIIGLSEIGFGDPEQLRYHSIFPVQFGGRTDLYARTAALPQTTIINKTATLISINGTVGTWQFNILNTDAPGFYQVTNIRQTGATTGGYAVLSDTRGFNLTGSPVPDIMSATEANFSSYSTSVITFIDTSTNASALTVNVSTKNYDVYIQAFPLFSQLQSFVNQPGVYVSDVLVKAPIPCFVSLSFTINVSSTDPTPNTGAVISAVCSAVNSVAFAGSLSGSIISKAAHGVLTGSASISGISMVGTILNTNSTQTIISSSQLLTVPAISGSPTTTANTVAFILNPNSVAVSVTTM